LRLVVASENTQSVRLFVHIWPDGIRADDINGRTPGPATSAPAGTGLWNVGQRT
jgi:hypothetical protein